MRSQILRTRENIEQYTVQFIAAVCRIILDNNILHNKVNDTYVSFFSKDEVLNLFSDFKTLLISDSYCLEQKRQIPQYAGVIKYIGQKL